MVCLRCGYCCKKLFVVIPKDPSKGLREDNLIVHMGDGPCIHLKGDKPGKYSCAIHDKKWYKRTPCFQHGQIEKDVNQLCRTGNFILNKKRN